MIPPEDEHEAMRDLVAAYALDAVDPDEAALVEGHLRVCVRCRAELAAHRETASMLGHSGGPAPEGVWKRIAASLEDAAAPAPTIPIFGRQTRRRRWTRGAAGLLTGAAAAAIAVLGVSVAHQSDQLHRINAAVAQQALLRQVTAAAIDPAAHRIALGAWNSPTRAEAVVLPDGRGYVTADGLAALSPERTYQLWAIVKGHPVSAGLLGSAPEVATFHLPRGTSTLAITDEAAGGAAQPTSAPLAAGAV